MTRTNLIRLWSPFVAAFLFLAPAAAIADFEDAKLTASDGAAGDFFGFSVSISGDTALIGAKNDDDSGNESGSAYVLRYNGTSWVEEPKLTASDGAQGDAFGYSVSISSGTALVGAWSDNSLLGSAYVFRYDGSNWVQEAKLTASDGVSGDAFGFSVSISGDTALVGAVGDDDDGSSSGSAYVFRYNGSNWVEEPKFTASDGAAGDEFGFSVSISGDTALVGAHGDDDAGASSGSAYVFRYNGSNWVEEPKFTASDAAASDEFGISVSIARNTALIGAHGDDDNGSSSGAAYVFRYNGSSWVEEQKLTASDGSAGNQLGYSVSVSNGTALVGARGDDDTGAGSGSAYLFSYNGSTWVEGAKLTASDGTALDTFGRSVSISDGTALVGAHGNDDNGSNSGSAYVFGEPVPISQLPALGPLGIAILLGLLGATAYWRLRDSASAA